MKKAAQFIVNELTRFIVSSDRLLMFAYKLYYRYISLFSRVMHFFDVRIGANIPTLDKIYIHIFGKAFSKHASDDEGRYLLYYGDNNCAGIGHLGLNLQVMLSEAVGLDRIPVLTTPNLHQKHNHGIILNASWPRYYDIRKSMQDKSRGASYIMYADFIKKSFTKNEVLLVGAHEQITDAHNQSYKLIIRDIRGTLLYYRLRHAPAVKLPLYPSKEVIAASKKVIDELPNQYCGIHVRRTDRVENAGYKEATSAENVLRILKQHNPDKLPVFLMTDEPDRKFYKNLESEFQIIRYYHFEHLRKIAKKNNYLLYLVEERIRYAAEIRIGMSWEGNKSDQITLLQKPDKKMSHERS
jgi:hypothetical protein